jgi:hypothetical protein
MISLSQTVSDPMMKFNDQDRESSRVACHPERSEGSRSMGSQMLRYAEHDTTGFGRSSS